MSSQSIDLHTHQSMLNRSIMLALLDIAHAIYKNDWNDSVSQLFVQLLQAGCKSVASCGT